MQKQKILNKVDEIAKTIKRDHLNFYIKKNFPELFDAIQKLTANLDKFKRIKKDKEYPVSLFERLYCITHELTDRPKCIFCQTNYVTQFIISENQYSKWCSISCSCKDKTTIQKSKQTRKEKYGKENYVNIRKARKTRISKNSGQWHAKNFGDKVKHAKLINHGNETSMLMLTRPNKPKRKNTVTPVIIIMNKANKLT